MGQPSRRSGVWTSGSPSTTRWGGASSDGHRIRRRSQPGRGRYAAHCDPRPAEEPFARHPDRPAHSPVFTREHGAQPGEEPSPTVQRSDRPAHSLVPGEEHAVVTLLNESEPAAGPAAAARAVIAALPPGCPGDGRSGPRSKRLPARHFQRL